MRRPRPEETDAPGDAPARPRRGHLRHRLARQRGSARLNERFECPHERARGVAVKWPNDGAKVNASFVAEGKKIYEVKCSGCHKLTNEKLVGPGWKGVSERNKPEWIMNFITNPNAMIDKDPKLQAQLELCLVRMPNQSLSDDDARHLLEFMRQNDGVK